MKMLDLCSGLGGASQAFLDRGWKVIRIDNDVKFKDVRETLIKDVTDQITLRMLDKLHHTVDEFDFVWASPTCTEFTKWGMPWYPNKTPSMSITNSCFEIIQTISPKFWIIENVRFAKKWYKELLGNPIKQFSGHYLWGEFPIFDLKYTKKKWRLPPTKDRPQIRAEIPYNLSLNLCKAIEREVEI